MEHVQDNPTRKLPSFIHLGSPEWIWCFICAPKWWDLDLTIWTPQDPLSKGPRRFPSSISEGRHSAQWLKELGVDLLSPLDHRFVVLRSDPGHLVTRFGETQVRRQKPPCIIYSNVLSFSLTRDSNQLLFDVDSLVCPDIPIRVPRINIRMSCSGVWGSGTP